MRNNTNILRTSGTLLFLVLISFHTSCRTEFSFRPVEASDLRFSRDTVYLDTVFTGISSATYPLKVYNNSDAAVSIPSVYLESGDDSNFRLNVDGLSGKSFSNVELLPKDSMYVFIETTADIGQLTQNENQFLYEDKLHFTNSGSVSLLTLVQDAVFLYPEKDEQGIKESIPIGVDGQGNSLGLNGFFLDDDELIFTNEKPYVVFGYMGVPASKTVVFEAGARVHFHRDSGIIVARDATMIVNGTASSDPEALEGEVIFEGDRLEPLYDDIPGQWGAIWLTAGSTQHKFNHITIKNATVGVLMDYNDESASPTLTLKNTKIYNSASVNLWGKTAHIYAENSVFGSAGQLSFFGNIGGEYEFVHCTFANYWNKSFRTTPAVLLNDYTPIDSDNNFIKPLTQANFHNCIIEGNQLVEFFVTQEGTDPLRFNLNHTAIQFESSSNTVVDNPYFDWNDAMFYNQLTRNATPGFVLPEEHDYRINQESDFIGIGNQTQADLVPLDLLGKDRRNAVDLGAYQHVIIDN